jgi:hypothetical protein
MRHWLVFGPYRTLRLLLRLLPLLILRFLNNPKAAIDTLRGKNAPPS